MIRLNNDWEFVFNWTDGFGRGEGTAEAVRLPHTVRELPLHYADSAAYETVSGYRRRIAVPGSARGSRVFLQFDGAAHIATVYLNGRELAVHRCGYTSFRVELTDEVTFGGEDLVAVKLDSTENPAVPPFGFLIDYLTYGGLYRDVWLDIRPRKLLSDLFVYTPGLSRARVSWTACLEPGDSVRVEIVSPDGRTVARGEAAAGESGLELDAPGVTPWSLETPVLYTARATVLENGAAGDSVSVDFGFRTVEFRADGFFLNGQKVFLRGLNRHQAYPYMGYAAPERLQREDARILKRELGLTAVRTSHYPQSHYFLDECDRQGLLVFTEIPGWQHMGDEAWEEQALENVREMVTQYRCHPSVVLWGVRINESQDNDRLYARTNALARALDPSRPTSGVRCILKSRLLEDVYAYNDFSHRGDNPGVRPRDTVLRREDLDRPLLVSESCGHMFPTKSWDPWSRRQEQALRHARVLNDAAADGGHLGMFAWCMFDYPTHRDFGSGDRICYHGVLDSFRNPKTAAAVYASQSEDRPVLEIGSSMDIGDYNEGRVESVYAFTNADSVRLYKNGVYVWEFVPRGWEGLKHGPVLIDDTVGVQLETREGFDNARADAVRRVLLSAGKYGFEHMPEADRQALSRCMSDFDMSFEEIYGLYGKYVGNWGDTAPVWRFDAVKDGKVAASVTRGPSASLHLEVTACTDTLSEGGVWDAAAVRIRVLDSNGNVASYAQLPVHLELTGDAELIGPGDIAAEGGACGTYVRTVGRAGSAVLTVSTPQTESVTIRFTVQEETRP